MVVGYLVDVEFSWGFQSRVVGLSKSSPSFLYPPPSTFLGALTEVLAKGLELGEKRGKELIPALGQKLLSLGFKPLNCVPIKYEDLNKIIAVKETGGVSYPSPKKLAGSFDSPARGKTSLSSLDDQPPRIRWFLVLKDSEVEIRAKKYELSEDHFWEIHRLGSKESVVCVVRVSQVFPEPVTETKVVTGYSFPVTREVLPQFEKREKWEYEVYLNPFKSGLSEYSPVEDYVAGRDLLLYRVPILRSLLSPPEYVVQLGPNGVAYRHEDELVVGCPRPR